MREAESESSNCVQKSRTKVILDHDYVKLRFLSSDQARKDNSSFGMLHNVIVVRSLAAMTGHSSGTLPLRSNLGGYTD